MASGITSRARSAFESIGNSRAGRWLAGQASPP
jgi:hypothetical protein